MTQDARWDFFVSYASKDREIADALYDLLSPPFKVFLDRRQMLPGDDWDSRLSIEQRRAAVVLVLISPRTDSAYYQREEIAAAVDLSRRERDSQLVVPIFLDDMGEDLTLPYGLRLKHGISIKREGGLTQVAHRLKTSLRSRLAMPAAEIRRRYETRAPVRRGVRLVPRATFDADGSLGPSERKYVFVGDYEEQRHRTLRQVLTNLWIGDAFERVDNSNIDWLALTFDLGELNSRKMDLLPATWKASFRILSDPKRAGCFEASEEEQGLLGRPPRDYYSADQSLWYSRCTIAERRYTPWGTDYYLSAILGISFLSFDGRGFTERHEGRDGVPSRVFLIRNLPLSAISYQRQDLGNPDQDLVLD